MIGIFIFLSLKAIFRLPEYILAISVVGAFLVFPFCQLHMLIHYYTMPLLLTTIYCFCFIKLICNAKHPSGWICGLGVLYSLMIAARLPLILFGGIPVFYYLLKVVIKREKKINWGSVLWFAAGCAIGALAVTPLFIGLDFDVIVCDIPWSSAVKWIGLSVIGLIAAWSLTLPLLAGCWCLSLFPASKKVLLSLAAGMVVFAATCFFVIYQCPAVVAIPGTNYFEIFEIASNCIAMLLLIGIFAHIFYRSWYFSQKDIKISDLDFLLLTLTLFAAYCIFPLGTNGWATNHPFGLILLTAILNALVWSAIRGNSRLKKASFLPILLGFPLLGMVCTLNYSYREENKLQLDTRIDIPALHNIKTSKKYAPEYSVSYAKLKSLVHKGETMLVTDNNYLWNWLLETKVFAAWFRYPELEETMQKPGIALPDCILLIKKSTRAFSGYQEHLTWWKNVFLPQRYQKIYADDYCELYRKQ